MEKNGITNVFEKIWFEVVSCNGSKVTLADGLLNLGKACRNAGYAIDWDRYDELSVPELIESGICEPWKHIEQRNEPPYDWYIKDGWKPSFVSDK